MSFRKADDRGFHKNYQIKSGWACAVNVIFLIAIEATAENPYPERVFEI
jgi:hypothetical protein